MASLKALPTISPKNFDFRSTIILIIPYFALYQKGFKFYIYFKGDMEEKDYYQILGVDEDASFSKIKEAYRRLAFQYHPDKNKGNPSSLERMKDINEAYAILSNPEKRRRYDSMRKQYGAYAHERFRESYSEEDIFRGSDINQIFEEMARNFGFRGFEEIFRESYGQVYRTFEFKRPGIFARGFVFFGPFSYRKKMDQTDSMKTPQTFPKYLGKFSQFILNNIFGLKISERGKDLYEVIYLDPRQASEGGKGRYFHRRRSKELIINIPPGIKEGQKIRLKGMGALGKRGGEAGDLYLKVKIKKPIFEKMVGLLKRWIKFFLR